MKRLSWDEVNAVVEKIRRKYEDYMVQFMKSSYYKEQFEKRYHEALRRDVHMLPFLQAEIDVVEELSRRELEQAIKKSELQKVTVKEKGFADRVIEQHNKMIESYPEVDLSEAVHYEVKKLFGALIEFGRSYWHDVDRLFRVYYPSPYSKYRINLENQFYQLCVPTENKIPVRMIHYVNLFHTFPRNMDQIEKEKKNCILEAAFLLHDLEDGIGEILNDTALKKGDRAILDQAAEYISGLIRNFRLKELKPEIRYGY